MPKVIDNRIRYAVGIILDSLDDKLKIKKFFDGMKGLVDVQQLNDVDSNFQEKVSAKGNVDTDVNFFVGIGKNVDKETRDSIGGSDDGMGDYYLPNMRFMYFGEDYTLEQMKQRLIQWMGEQWGVGYIMRDSSSSIKDLVKEIKPHG